jgi:hypothetical protein
MVVNAETLEERGEGECRGTRSHEHGGQANSREAYAMGRVRGMRGLRASAGTAQTLRVEVGVEGDKHGYEDGERDKKICAARGQQSEPNYILTDGSH